MLPAVDVGGERKEVVDAVAPGSKSSRCAPAELVDDSQKAALCEPRRVDAELPQASSARRMLAPNPIRFKSKPPSASPPLSSTRSPARLRLKHIRNVYHTHSRHLTRLATVSHTRIDSCTSVLHYTAGATT